MTEDFTGDSGLFFPIPNPNRDPAPSLPSRYPASSRLVAIKDDHAIWSATPHLYASLLLAALGAGGILPCVVAFGAEQFPEKERKKTWSFFNWYYFCMGTTMVVAVAAVVYVQDNVGWGWGLGIPTVAMGISLVSFAAGFPIYLMVPPTERARSRGWRRWRWRDEEEEAAGAGGSRVALPERRARRSHFTDGEACTVHTNGLRLVLKELIELINML
ncbi:putative nitrite transporter [Apostasia shenzhenica]|uniref:Putative nitrite transporter n=1 Tax=Apostasia shenzhenica TaxID=1088818 RepID=A0A2I0AJ83_9ASPA|nr:putative nitrite transporter [Apostasia shenzhenica]